MVVVVVLVVAAVGAVAAASISIVEAEHYSVCVLAFASNKCLCCSCARRRVVMSALRLFVVVSQSF